MNPRRRAGGQGVRRARWLARLLREWRLDRNPLRRGLDRAETVVVGLLLVAFGVGAPFVAHAAGTWTYDRSAREAQAQQATLHQVKATLLEKAPAWNGFVGAPGATPEVTARWRAPDGRLRTGELFVPEGGAAGSTVTVWTDKAGQLAGPPLRHTQVMNRAQVAETFAVACLAVVSIVIGWLARKELGRRRLAAWDADWLATGPRWSPRR
jgi:hypothetical protein